MLGSHFDLDREIARIASKREAQARETQARRTRVYSDFDRRLTDFVRSVGDTGSQRADRSAAERRLSGATTGDRPIVA